MKWKIATLLTAVVAIAGWFFFVTSDQNLPDAKNPVASEGAVQNEAARVAAESHSVSTLSAKASAIRDRIGGPGMNLRESLLEVAARDGTDSQAFGGMLTLAVGACSSEQLTNEKAKKDPQKAWAIQYVQAACKDFNPEQFKYTGTDSGLLNAELTKGRAAAVAQAAQDIKRTDNLLTVVQAGLYLIEQGQLPNRESYDLDDEQLAKALGFASGLRTCASMNACGSQSLLTAQVCSNNGCPPGSDYAQAMRNILSPKEYAAALRLKDDLARL